MPRPLVILRQEFEFECNAPGVSLKFRGIGGKISMDLLLPEKLTVWN